MANDGAGNNKEKVGLQPNLRSATKNNTLDIGFSVKQGPNLPEMGNKRK